MNIICFSGSLRQGSYNTSLLKAFQKLAPSGVSLTVEDITALPLYNPEYDTAYPESVTELKTRVASADAVIIATPEYNRSVPGGLKNAIDWISRPYGTNAFAGKPVLLAGVSSGKIGTAIAQSHLRETMLYLDALVVGQPELYLGPAKEIFNDDGEVLQDSTNELLSKALTKLISLVQK